MQKSLFIIVLLFATVFCFGQRRGEFVPNYDESKVPQFELPNPLTSFSGRKIKNTRRWERVRRPELLDFFSNNVYGKVPGNLEISKWEVVEESDNALNGKARRKQVDIVFNKNGRTLFFNVLMYLPKNVEKAPVFLGYNFYGNHTVCNDVNIRISNAWTRDNESYGIANNQLTEKSRGVSKDSWQVDKIIDTGYGLATIFYCEVDPDKNDFTDGIHPLLYTDDQQRPAASEWGSIAAWAWGLSRAMDYLEQDKDVDASKVIVFGHSRLGKTSLWAGATDERFAAVISNNSGCGGAALSKRQFGETVARINNSFPHWFARNFRSYNLNEKALPADQHELLALIAPRPLYVTSAEDDQWADPRGEFLSSHYATPVYELYNKQGISTVEMPQVNQPIINTVAYHIRTGGHGVTAFDWNQYIKWADKNLFNKEIFEPQTRVSIEEEKFFINGKPTFEGRTWQGISVEGLLPNSRMVQGVFDDLNPETVDKWKYPDTGKWDPERNTREFIEAMPEWQKHGLLAFTINFQGGSPEGYSANQPWENNAFETDGKLRPEFANRMERIVKKADELGMVVMLGIFYFGQDERLENEKAVIAAVDNVVEWIQKKGFTNILIEVANECNNRKYDHEIIKQDRMHELILRVKEKAPELLVSASFNGNTIPPDKIVEVSDFVFLHGNGVKQPERIIEMVEIVRSLLSYRPMPVVFNEDDHYDYDKPANNFVNATKAYASWGFFDFRREGESFDEGYQSVPVNWGISSLRKKEFFNKVKEIFID
ncbi:alpha/beta hydrolase family protein [Mariniphaga sp.]|uniref:alpha/beta hydrolase family protein n=1 Tax=Mariniphaga sp. TaxID=1954475 RepID=UPI0035625363